MVTFRRCCLCFVCLAAVRFAALGQTTDCTAAHAEFKTLDARGALNRGVKAFKSAHYDEAIADFQNALDLDPCLPNAKSYLGTALATEVFPGLETAENLALAQRATEQFKDVVAADPHDVNSMKQLANVYYNIQRYDEAKKWQKQVLAEDATDPEAAYIVGVIDWTLAFQHALRALQTAGLTDDGQGNLKAPAEVHAAIQSENAALVTEAIEYLKRAIANRPKYDAAMQYLNLVYRRKADLDWDDANARENDLAEANAWTVRAMETRKALESIGKPAGDSTQP